MGLPEDNLRAINLKPPIKDSMRLRLVLTSVLALAAIQSLPAQSHITSPLEEFGHNIKKWQDNHRSDHQGNAEKRARAGG